MRALARSSDRLEACPTLAKRPSQDHQWPGADAPGLSGKQDLALNSQPDSFGKFPHFL
jgi:hypothetical protein